MSRIKIEDVQINSIKIIENIRTNANDSNIKDLMSSIKQHGLEQPIKVGLTKSGDYMLIFGQRRLIACRKLGHKTIPAQVVNEPDMKEFLISNITENLQRKDNSPSELGRLCVMLKERYEMSNDEISI